MDDTLFMDDALGEPYMDPVMAEDGFIYERAFIETWFSSCVGALRSPKTLLPMGSNLYYPFEYYKLRDAWACTRGLTLPPKPKCYGLVRGPPQTQFEPAWLNDPHHFPPLNF